MSGPPPIEVLRERFKAFLIFTKTKLLADGADLDRLAQLRRLSDVRIRQFSVGKAQVTAADLAGLLSDPRTGRFDALAEEAGLVRAGHLALPLAPLGEEMGYTVEVALTLQIVGAERMRALFKEFVSNKGPVREAPAAAAPAVPAKAPPKPLPPAVGKLLGNARDLWTIPAPMTRILDLLQTPDRPPDPACAEIEKAPALSAMCLRIVNAAGAALGTRISSVKRAVVTLGYPAMRRVISMSALLSTLGAPPADFWPHSLRVAHAASLAARGARLGNADDHFAAGLIHDVGRFVQARFLPSSKELAGTTSAEIGACVLERWSFAPAIVEAARHHLDAPDVLEGLQLPREAIVVSAMCRLSREGAGVDAWSGLLRLPANRIEELRFESTKLADASLKEILS
jgi:HD-like signal output (HDOD) protein